MRRTVIILTTALLLSGCASVENLLTPNVSQDAQTAAQATITAYADVYQPLVLAYGHLPKCVPGGPQVCHDVKVYAMLKSVDLAATKSIVAAQAVLEGNATDAGQIQAALAAISAAELQINASGIMQGQSQ